MGAIINIIIICRVCTKCLRNIIYDCFGTRERYIYTNISYSCSMRGRIDSVRSLKQWSSSAVQPALRHFIYISVCALNEGIILLACVLFIANIVWMLNVYRVILSCLELHRLFKGHGLCHEIFLICSILDGHDDMTDNLKARHHLIHYVTRIRVVFIIIIIIQAF